MDRRRFLRRCAAGLGTLACVRLGVGQEEPVEDLLPGWLRANAAAEAAHADCGGLAATDRPFARYVWIGDREPATAAALSYAVNLAASTGRVLHRPTLLAGGGVLRLDLRLLAPEPADLAKLIETWDRLEPAEPYFHALRPVVTKVAPYKATNGQTYDYKVKFLREFALHADPNALLSLRTFTGSECPIVEARWLLSRMLSTINGGLYYDFRRIEEKPAEGTALEAFLRSLGADPKALQSADPKNKAAVFFSGVTGKPRAVAFFFGRNTRPSDVPPLVTATLDIADGDVDPAQHPVYTLIGAKFRATEVIGFLPNGLPIYALFNAAGELQEDVPDNIARDGNIPFPHTDRLQPAIGCIRCHGPDEGFKPVHNDIADMVAVGYVPLADRNEADPARALDRIIGEYTGDLEEPLRQARNGHERAAFAVTGGIWEEKSCMTAAATISALEQQYRYDLVTPAVACREIGATVPAGDPRAAMALFDKLVPKSKPLPTGEQFEDPTIAGLRAGKAVLRFNWEHVYPDCALRSAPNLEAGP